MATPLTIVGIDVPRFPTKIAGEHRSGSEWVVAGQNILERAVKAALEVTGAEHIRLLTGAPDQGIFDLVEKYGVVETELPSWLQRSADLARSANEGDVAVFLRAGVLLRHYKPLRKAIDAVRHLKDVDRCEAAMRPERYATSLSNIHFVNRGDEGTRLQPCHEVLAQDLSDFAVLCPAFEVMKLRGFSMNRIGGVAQSGTAFVWVDEGDQVSLEGPIDWLRAEVMLESEREVDA
ncbi:MAG: hypothetical protein KDB07_12050 [Planctomycetes bacterium]|nr:hypothetical protein [Planctomycetota bacterium]